MVAGEEGGGGGPHPPHPRFRRSGGPQGIILSPYPRCVTHMRAGFGPRWAMAAISSRGEGGRPAPVRHARRHERGVLPAGGGGPQPPPHYPSRVRGRGAGPWPAASLGWAGARAACGDDRSAAQRWSDGGTQGDRLTPGRTQGRAAGPRPVAGPRRRGEAAGGSQQ